MVPLYQGQEGTRLLTDLQLKVRRTGITASELGAIMGKSAFAGPLEVWQTKMGLGEPVEQSSPMMMGTMLEAAISERIAEEKPGHRMIHATAFADVLAPLDYASPAIHLGDGTFRSKRYPRLIVTPDYVSQTKVLWAEEIKCVGRWSGANLFSPPSASKQRYPEGYAIQVVAQVGTLGLDGGRLWALVQNSTIPDKEVEWLFNESQTNPEHFMWWARGYVSRQSLRSYEIPYTVEAFEELGETATRFWVDHVETGKANPDWRPVVRPQSKARPPEDGGWGDAPEGEF